MDDHERILQLEACRPYSDDRHTIGGAELLEQLEKDPALRDLAGRIETIDARLTEAFHQIEPPPGLQQRLLDHLAQEPMNGTNFGANGEEPLDTVSPATAAVAQVAEAVEDAGDSHHRRAMRRRWVAAAVLGLAASIALIVFAPWQSASGPATLEQALTQSIDFFQSDDRGSGQPLKNAQVLQDYPVSSLVNLRQSPRWRRVSGFLGHRGVAYDLQGPRDTQATLYVVRARFAGLPGGPYQPRSTGGVWAAAWQQGDLAYVLVVRGNTLVTNPQRYFLNTDSQIL